MKLYEIGTIITGNTPSKNNDEYYISDDIMFIKPGDIEEKYITNLERSEGYISEKARNKVRILPKDTVLVTCIGTIGKVGILEKEGTCNQQINAIIPNDMIVSKYLAYLIKSKQKILQLKANAPVVPIINKTDFSKIDINICDIKEQKKIVKKLDLIKKIIDIRQEQLRKLNNIVKSQFVEMFGNPIINDKKFKFKQIGEVTKIVTGTTPDTNDVENWNGGINWITPAEIKEDTLYVYETERKITEKGQKSKSLTLMPKGTVIFSTRAPIGKTAIAGTEMCCNQGFKNCICSININNIYLYYVLKNNTIYFNNLGTGATFKELSKRVFEKVKIAIPPITLQNQFSEIVKEIDKQKFEIEKSLKETQELYESLMEKYFG